MYVFRADHSEIDLFKRFLFILLIDVYMCICLCEGTSYECVCGGHVVCFGGQQRVSDALKLKWLVVVSQWLSANRCGSWELISGLLEEQQILIIAALSLQHQQGTVLKRITEPSLLSFSFPPFISLLQGKWFCSAENPFHKPMRVWWFPTVRPTHYWSRLPKPGAKITPFLGWGDDSIVKVFAVRARSTEFHS